MNIEPGKSYKTRSGEVVRIIYIDLWDNIYPYQGDNTLWYDTKGRLNKYETNQLDIESEL